MPRYKQFNQHNMSNTTHDPARSDNRDNGMRAVSGTITFGELEIRYDAFEDIKTGALDKDSIAIMGWKMPGGKDSHWTNSQIESAYAAVEAALVKCETSVVLQIADAHNQP